MLFRSKIIKGQLVVIVWGPGQQMILTKDGQSAIQKIPVSTALNGFGFSSDSATTPTGFMKTGRKFLGKKYQVFVAKQPTDTILGPNEAGDRIVDGKKHTAEVLTGLIELHGMEDCNSNTFDRQIYIHGTNRERNLGQKASGGCVRVSNNNLIWLNNNIPPNTPVFIQGD